MNLMMQIIVVIAAAAILIQSICIVNRMTPRTHHVVRVAYVVLSAGAFGEIIGIFNGHIPGLEETLMVIGVGMHIAIDRRACRNCLAGADCVERRS